MCPLPYVVFYSYSTPMPRVFNRCVSAQRTTVKRTCIKSLPSVLCIHLMRFGFDWESGRSIKYDEQIRVQRVLYTKYISCFCYAASETKCVMCCHVVRSSPGC